MRNGDDKRSKPRGQAAEPLRPDVALLPSAAALRRRIPSLFAFLAGFVGSVAGIAGEPPLPPPRPADLSPAPKPAEPAPPSPAASDGAAACVAALLADGVAAQAETAPTASVEGCGIEGPVRMSSITTANDPVNLPDRPLVACAFARVLGDYVRLIVAPLGEAMLNAKVAAIETGPGYECRTQDRIAGAKISAHAKGLAVDFTAIAFADKRRLSVERPSDAAESAYFRAVRTAACGWFTTVLGPGADAFHANNLHLDVEIHGANASYRICE